MSCYERITNLALDFIDILSKEGTASAKEKIERARETHTKEEVDQGLMIAMKVIAKSR